MMWFFIYFFIGALFGFIFLGVSEGMLKKGVIQQIDFDNYRGLSFLIGIAWIAVVPIMMILLILFVVKEISKQTYEKYTNS